MKHNYLIVVLMLFTSFAEGKEKSDMEIIREKIYAEYSAYNPDDRRVRHILETLKDDGTWPGINYADTSRIAFEHTRHLDNMILMARAYTIKDSKYKGDKQLKQAIDKSLNYWLENDFICENWWNNQIGTPGSMINLLYLLDNDLTREQTDKMIRIAGRANMNASGARPSGDRVKIAALLAKNLLFQRNEAAFDEIIKIIEGEMKLYTKESEAVNAEGSRNRNYFEGGRGMQADFSFHHRIDRVNNTTSYGLGFLSSYVEFAELVNGTKYQFTGNAVKLATDYFLDGICKQMIYGRSVDPGVMNRDITRPKSKEFADSALPESLLRLSDYRRDELESIIHARKGEPFTPASYAKFFWQTEHFVFQRPTFYTSVRMFSVRNRNMEEPYNGEGLINHYRADGTNYLSLDGNEYLNIVPAFNFRKIPGTTVVQADTMPSERTVQQNGLTEFVGGVTDGLYGAAAFDFKSPHNPLSARKAWFFFDDCYVCLGADIGSIDRFPVATTLNQCYLRSDVTVNRGAENTVTGKGSRTLDGVKWIFHDHTGYIFPLSQKIGLSNQTESGSWFKANRQTSVSKEMIGKDIFTLWIDHGVKPSAAGYEYIVMPATDIAKIEKFTAQPTVKILNNTKSIQSVKSSDLAYFVFYEPGEAGVTDDLNIRANAPCMIMLSLKNNKIEAISISDPLRKSAAVEITVNSKINVSDENVSAVWDKKSNTTGLTVKLPQDDFAGKSVTFSLLK
jgi:chondroitin AC lyase